MKETLYYVAIPTLTLGGRTFIYFSTWNGILQWAINVEDAWLLKTKAEADRLVGIIKKSNPELDVRAYSGEFDL